MDELGSFLASCCLVGSGYKASAHDLYETYKTWCEENDEESLLSQRAFSLTLKANGFKRFRSTLGLTWYSGIGLSEEEPIIVA